MSTTIRIEHLARVEGHGGVTVEMEGGAIREVKFDVFEGHGCSRDSSAAAAMRTSRRSCRESVRSARPRIP